MWIEIDNDQHQVGTVWRLLAEAQQLIVGNLVKSQCVIVLKRRILTPDSVNQANEFREAVGFLQVPVFHFILLGIEILLATGTNRLIYKLLERRTVDSI